MAKRKSPRRKRGTKKYKDDFVREQMRQGRSKRQALATYKMLRASAKHRRTYKLNPTPNSHILGVDPADVNIANPWEAEHYADNRYVREGPLFEMWFGAVGATQIYVWAGSFDDAFEEAVEWLDDQGLCGYFVTLDEGDIIDAAEDVGYSQSRAEKFAKDFFAGKVDWGDEDVSDIVQRAEADLTSIGHTTLKCEKEIGGPLYVPSWEWGGHEHHPTTSSEVIQAVYDESMRREQEDED